MGSVRVARRAGSHEATRVMAMSRRATPATTRGSLPGTTGIMFPSTVKSAADAASPGPRRTP